MIAPRRRCCGVSVLLAIVLSVWAMTARAQEPRVRGYLADTGPVWVGQGVNLVVEILVPGYFDSAVHFQLPDPAGVLLMPPQGRPLLGNETLDGMQFTVQRHELKAWPMRAGNVSIPSFSATFYWKQNPLDKQGQPGAVTIQPLPVQAQSPPGAEDLGLVISARKLQWRESWQPEPGEQPVKAGTAFTRTLTWSAPDVPGMLFPPFPDEPLDGISVYGNQQLRDREDRGDFIGQRRDEISYVFQRPGQFTLPAVQFTWFDLDSQQLRTEMFPARTFNVVVNPQLAASAVNGKPGPLFTGITWQRIALSLLVVALVLAAAFSRPVRRAFRRLIAPLRAVHLQPLNPSGLKQR